MCDLLAEDVILQPTEPIDVGIVNRESHLPFSHGLRLHHTLQIPLHRIPCLLKPSRSLRVHDSGIPIRLFRVKLRPRRPRRPHKRLQKLRALMNRRPTRLRRAGEQMHDVVQLELAPRLDLHDIRPVDCHGAVLAAPDDDRACILRHAGRVHGVLDVGRGQDAGAGGLGDDGGDVAVVEELAGESAGAADGCDVDVLAVGEGLVNEDGLAFGGLRWFYGWSDFWQEVGPSGGILEVEAAGGERDCLFYDDSHAGGLERRRGHRRWTGTTRMLLRQSVCVMRGTRAFAVDVEQRRVGNGKS